MWDCLEGAAAFITRRALTVTSTFHCLPPPWTWPAWLQRSAEQVAPSRPSWSAVWLGGRSLRQPPRCLSRLEETRRGQPPNQARRSRCVWSARAGGSRTAGSGSRRATCRHPHCTSLWSPPKGAVKLNEQHSFLFTNKLMLQVYVLIMHSKLSIWNEHIII